MDNTLPHRRPSVLKKRWAYLESQSEIRPLSIEEHKELRRIEEELKAIKSSEPKIPDWPERIWRVLIINGGEMTLLDIYDALEPYDELKKRALYQAIRREVQQEHLIPIRNRLGNVTAVKIPKGKTLESRLAFNPHRPK